MITTITNENILEFLREYDDFWRKQMNSNAICSMGGFDKAFHNWFIGHKYWREFLWLIDGQKEDKLEFYKSIDGKYNCVFTESWKDQVKITPIIHQDDTMSLYVHLPDSQDKDYVGDFGETRRNDSFSTMFFPLVDIRLIDFFGKQARGKFIDFEVRTIKNNVKEQYKVINRLKNEKKSLKSGVLKTTVQNHLKTLYM